MIDILFAGAHPDDVELCCGGVIASVVKEGKSAAIVDFTAGELGSRGNENIRLEEAKKAANILGVEHRVNLHLPDGNVKVDDNSIEKTIEIIRHFRPKILVMPPEFERHPDHEAVHRILRTAMFKSGLKRIETQFEGITQEPYRIRKMFCYMQLYPFLRNPNFIVDISDTFETKVNAIKAYSSQFFIPGESNKDSTVTHLYRPEFLGEAEARAIYFGSLIGVCFGEVFYSIEPLGIKSISAFL